MSYLHLTRTRTRERTPEYESYYSRPLVHHDSSKRRRSITLSDLDDEDGHDDYPYSSNHKPARPSRALTVRDQPLQLKRYNVWADNRRPQNDAEDENRRRSYETRRTYKYSSDRAASSEPDDQDLHLSINANFWGDSPFEEKETEEEKWRSYHRVGGREVERESVRPLSGWRRRNIILGDD
ncbi:hypothetical protein J4E91_000532 [Alternaria rosae]|nr:hypothetical protein J4E91_000532 [Alternaria rosae]